MQRRIVKRYDNYRLKKNKIKAVGCCYFFKKSLVKFMFSTYHKGQPTHVAYTKSTSSSLVSLSIWVKPYIICSWCSILKDTKNGLGNAVNKPHTDIIYRFYVKVERTILYIQMLLTNWLKSWRKKIQRGVPPCIIVNAQCLGHSLWMRIVIEVTKIWYLRQEVFN